MHLLSLFTFLLLTLFGGDPCWAEPKEAGVGAQDVKALLKQAEKKANKQKNSPLPPSPEKPVSKKTPVFSKDPKKKEEMALSASATLLFDVSGMSMELGKHKLGVDHDQVITLKNVGATSATQITPILLRGAFTYKGGLFPGQGGTCGREILAGSQCTLMVRFQSRVPGVHSTDLSLTYLSGPEEQKTSIRLNASSALPGRLQIVNKDALDFGDVVLRNTEVRQITLQNTGESRVGNLHPAAPDIPSPFGYTGAHYPGAKVSCKINLEPGETCVLEVRASPERPGAQVEKFTLNYLDGIRKEKLTVALNIKGLAPAKLTSRWVEGNFVPLILGQSSERVLELTNEGETPAVLQSKPQLSAPFSLVGEDCGGMIQKKSKCTLKIRLEAQQVGKAIAQYKWTYHDGHQVQSMSQQIETTVLKPADLVLSLGQKNLGELTVGNTFQGTLSISNHGEVLASQIDFSGLKAPFVLGRHSKQCQKQLKPLEQCSIQIDGRLDRPGVFESGLSVSYFDGVQKQSKSTQFEITGLLPAQLSFGPLVSPPPMILGSQYQAEIVVENKGESFASLKDVRSTNPVFNVLSKSGSECRTLGPKAQCKFSIVSKPEAAQAHLTEVQFYYFDGYQDQMAKQSLSLNIVTPARLTGLDPQTDFGKVLIGKNEKREWILRNDGRTDAEKIKLQLSDPEIVLTHDCKEVLKRNATCRLAVTWSPSRKAHLKRSLEYEYFDGFHPRKAKVDFSGEALEPGRLSLDLKEVDFGKVTAGNSVHKLIQVQNMGDVAATLGKPELGTRSDIELGAQPDSCPIGPLEAKQSCKIRVELKATTLGMHATQLQMAYGTGMGEEKLLLRISAQVVSPARLSFEQSLVDFGSLPLGKVATQKIKITNQGETWASLGELQGLSAPFTFAGGPYPGKEGTCGKTLAPMLGCVLSVQVKGEKAGEEKRTLSLAYGDGQSERTVSVEVFASLKRPAQLSFVEGTDFGFLYSGQVQEKTVQVTNIGDWPAKEVKPTGPGFKRPLTYKGERYPGSGGSCGSTLAVGVSCTLVLRFSPNIPAAIDGALMLSYFDGVNSRIAETEVKGYAILPAKVSLIQKPPVRTDPVVVGSKKQFNVTIFNEGLWKATGLEGIVKSGKIRFVGDVYPGSGGTCKSELEVSAKCELNFEFNADAAGKGDSQVALKYFDGLKERNLEFPIEARGITPGKLELVKGQPLEAGAVIVGGEGKWITKVTNLGEAPVKFLGSEFGAKGFDFTEGEFPGDKGTCQGVLAPGKECLIELVFHPLTTGTFQTHLRTRYEDGLAEQKIELTLSGTGLSPARLDFSKKKLEFDPLVVGLSSTQEIEVQNTGDSVATLREVSGASKAFSFVGGKFPGKQGTCKKNLKSGETCKMNIAFAPPSGDVWDAEIELSFHDGRKVVEAEFLVVGRGLEPAFLELEESHDFERRSVGLSPVQKKITIKNIGESLATDLGKTRGLEQSFRFVGGSFPGKDGTCADTLDPGKQCEIHVELRTDEPGRFKEALKIGYRNGAAPALAQSLLVGKIDTLASLKVTPIEIDFGEIIEGRTEPRIIRVQNAGETSATSLNFNLEGDSYAYTNGKAPGDRGNCTETLKPGASCQLEIEFRPERAQKYPGGISVSYSDGAQEQSLSITLIGSGRALPPPKTRQISNVPQ